MATFDAASPSQFSSVVRGASASKRNVHDPPHRRQSSDFSDASSHRPVMKAKRQNDNTETTRSKSYSLSSRNTHTSQSTRTANIAAQRDVRTLPSWIDSYEEGQESHAHNKPDARRLVTPPKSHNAHHNSSPAKTERRISKDGYEDSGDEWSGNHEKAPERGIFGGHKEPERGRRWDHAREHTPVIMQTGPDSGADSWRTFVKASMYGPGLADEGKRVDEKFLAELTPGYQQPWRGDAEGDDVENGLGLLHLHNKKQRRKWYLRIQVCLDLKMVQPHRANDNVEHPSDAPLSAIVLPSDSPYNINCCIRTVRVCL